MKNMWNGKDMYEFMKATKPDALGSLLIEYVEGLKKELKNNNKKIQDV